MDRNLRTLKESYDAAIARMQDQPTETVEPKTKGKRSQRRYKTSMGGRVLRFNDNEVLSK